MTMRTPAAVLLAGAVAAVGSLTWAQDAVTPTVPNPSVPNHAGAMKPASAPPALPAGVKSKELDDKEDILEVIAAAANAAVTKDGLDDLVERLNDQDRNRLGANNALDNDEWEKSLNARIDTIRAAWKTKYNDELEVDDDEEEVYAGVTILQGEIEDANAVMRHWPLAATGMRADGAGGAMATTRTSQENPSVREQPDEAANLEKGREVAVVHFPAHSQAPALTLSLVGEIQGWKVDVPNSLSTQQLYQKVSTHLDHFNSMSAQWPADEKQARAMLTRHIMMALYNVPASAGGAMPVR